MASKRYLLLIFPLIITVMFLFVAFTDTEDEKNRQSFHEHYVVHSIDLPTSVKFAGESISLDEPDLKERFDRELLTNIYWQSQTILFIKRSHKWFPVIEQVLKEEGIPSDFKYLAVAESGLLYNVVSPSNATGYWQFLEPTAKRYGLIVTEETDERFHLEKSTRAACAYFREAYSEFGNWSLVAASYNMGIDGVRKQLQMQRVTRYHDLYLNNETSRYLFRILAIKAVLEQPEQFGFHVPFSQRYQPENLFRVRVSQPISDIAGLAIANGFTYKLIKTYNPWLRKNNLTYTGNPLYISLPASLLSLSVFSGKVMNDTIDLSLLNLSDSK
jgi:hypothetical protein